MVKTRYWSKVLIEYDDETNLFRIIKGFHQLEAGTASKKTKKRVVESKAESGEVIF